MSYNVQGQIDEYYDAWEHLANLGIVDWYDSHEYWRVVGMWHDAGRPIGRRGIAFIVRQANLGVGDDT